MGGGRPVLPSWQNGHPYRPVAGSVKSFQAGIVDWGVETAIQRPLFYPQGFSSHPIDRYQPHDQ
jgi:hypothetical protein